MKKRIGLILISLIILAGCTNKKPDITLNVPIVQQGCAAFDKSYSDVVITEKGLRVISNIVYGSPCYTLQKAEISKNGDTLNVYFTFKKDPTTVCIQCLGVQNVVYTIEGPGLNKTGIKINVIAYFDNKKVEHSVTS